MKTTLEDQTTTTFFIAGSLAVIDKSCGNAVSSLAQLEKEIFDQSAHTFAILGTTQSISGILFQGGNRGFLDSITDITSNQACIGIESAIGLAGSWIGALCRRSCENAAMNILLHEKI